MNIKNTTTMILPTIHTNGTSAEMLREGYSNARLACIDARMSLAKIEFNGRDYYSQGQDAWRKADAEMRSRHERLSAIACELEEIELHIQDRIDEREAWKAAREGGTT